jgi:hypothetical protein
MKYAALIGVVGLAASAALAQTSELYISQIDANGMVVVQAGSVVRSWNNGTPGENALAVAGTIRTAGNYWSGSGNGAEYDLAGNPLGTSYTIFNGGGNWFDGTTDGRFHNYAVMHNGDYNLYSFDRDWSNAQVLFQVGFATSGVTYDTQNGTLWVTDSLSREVRQLDMGGNVLSSFFATDSAYAYGIAMDPADGSLWVGGYGSNMIYQYDQAGSLLNSLAVPNIGSAFGMEFAIPAPTTAGLLLLAGLGAIRRSRR